MKLAMRIVFTARDGSEAAITGNLDAIQALERIFKHAGVKFNHEVETWDEGYYKQIGKP